MLSSPQEPPYIPRFTVHRRCAPRRAAPRRAAPRRQSPGLSTSPLDRITLDLYLLLLFSAPPLFFPSFPFGPSRSLPRSGYKALYNDALRR